MGKYKTMYSSSVSAVATIILVTVVTIWADLSPVLKNWLASLAGHHWVTKSLMVAILFPLIWGLVNVFYRGSVSGEATRKSLWVLIAVTFLGFAAILGFYVWHYF